MAGILANSASKTMIAATADNAVTGYVEAEQVVLTTTPTATTYAWALAIPSDAAEARSFLDDDTAAAPRFTPDVGGAYVVTCTVDGGTSYALRLSVSPIATVEAVDAVRLTAREDSTVQAPTNPAAVALYYSADQGAIVTKFAGDSVATVGVPGPTGATGA